MASTTAGRPLRGGTLTIATVPFAAALLLVTVGATGAVAETGRLAAAAPLGATSGTATVSGGGFGHGVGLSQYGALGMARDGATATQILSHYYTGVTVAPYRDDVDVRVNVVHGGSSVTLRSTAQATGGGGLRLLPDGAAPVALEAGDTATLTFTSPSADAATPSPAVTATVTRADGSTSTLTAAGLDVRWPGTRLLAGAATTVDVTSTVAARHRARSYRWGSLRVSPVGKALDVVAVLGLHDEYLRGVAEVPSSWPSAALQAQLVAARNYALTAAQTAPKASCGGCQLWDDTRSQVYAGWSKESETRGGVRYGDRWVAALTATQGSATTGLAVLYGERPVTAYYASSTGGRTRDAADVWGRSLPYLTSVDDRWSADPTVNPSYARWTRTASVGRLLSLFSLPDVASVEITARDSGGAARTLTATAADGTRRSVTGDALARSLGLPATWITTIDLPGTSSGA
jgi:SpoIID/LytB domain protein